MVATPTLSEEEMNEVLFFQDSHKILKLMIYPNIGNEFLEIKQITIIYTFIQFLFTNNL